MAAATVNRRERYREYTRFLRVSADRLDMSVAPARLGQLRDRVNSERRAFLTWVVVWVLIAVVGALPLVMLLTAHFDLPMPALIGQQSDLLDSQLRIGNQPTNAILVAMGSALTFLVALLMAYAPVIAYTGALNDLEHAHRTLKAVERA